MTNLYPLMTVQDQIWDAITVAIDKAQNNGHLPACKLPQKSIEHPQNPTHGDYSSNIALRLSKPMKINPMRIAELIEEYLDIESPIGAVSVAKPGFLNFNLDPTWVKRQVHGIIEMGAEYGDISLGRGAKIQIEFVSVNPTGPLHIGHARGAVVGSSLSNILNAANFEASTTPCSHHVAVDFNTFGWIGFYDHVGHKRFRRSLDFETTHRSRRTCHNLTIAQEGFQSCRLTRVAV